MYQYKITERNYLQNKYRSFCGLYYSFVNIPVLLHSSFNYRIANLVRITKNYSSMLFPQKIISVILFLICSTGIAAQSQPASVYQRTTDLIKPGTYQTSDTKASLRINRITNQRKTEAFSIVHIENNLHTKEWFTLPATLGMDIVPKEAGAVTITKESVELLNDTTYAWKGIIYTKGNKEIGDIILIQNQEGEVNGIVDFYDGTMFEIEPISGKAHGFVKIKRNIEGFDDYYDVPGHAETPKNTPHIENTSAPVLHTTSFSGNPRCGLSIIRVLAVYTASAGSGRNVHNIALLDQTITNDVFENSKIHNTVRIEVVHTQQVSFNESGNIGTDHNILKADTQIALLRNTHKADMVVLYTDEGYFESGFQFFGNAGGIYPGGNNAYAIVEN